jgi:hypothetical protein
MEQTVKILLNNVQIREELLLIFKDFYSNMEVSEKDTLVLFFYLCEIRKFEINEKNWDDAYECAFYTMLSQYKCLFKIFSNLENNFFHPKIQNKRTYPNYTEFIGMITKP